MRFTIFTVVAAGASLSAAQDYGLPSTTTLTSTTTKVLTLTQCNPTVSDCPYRTTTSTEVLVETSTAQVETTSSEAETTSSEVETSTSVYVPPTTTSIEIPVVNTTTSTSTSSTSTKKVPSVKTTFYPAGNTTTKAGPTAPVTRTTKLNVPGTNVPEYPENPENPPTVPSGGSPSESAPVTVPTAAANGLVASSGFLGAALVAAFVALY
ncbi:hypothetical protein NW759_005602 [Fusarium solani]|jgi:hypothetical protein|uniref:GPI anchored serine-rich protein n=1 Tax=Fusarium solani TaxID=169388 RepID=A0A9P9KIC7_FUSSL|nr:uncharacterized protein B0J15DRAFT_525608 [Fusarium solani]KAH7258315.1 hypothetical protein B0J15DRAFT_525608 [Fusarium solani]KAJ4224898.1 hypothetical protein NW759_005602 [Fusarium solani]